MIVVDTSVWIEFFRRGGRASRLAELLEANEVLVHPSVVGELALGNLGAKRGAILGDLRQLPPAPVVDDGEILAMIDAHRLAGIGIGWVDVHLLGSARSAGARLWSLDRRLAEAALRLAVAG